MWVRPQDEIESHCQELQQSVFQLWELSHPCQTLWLLSMAPWAPVVSPRASATHPETMGERQIRYKEKECLPVPLLKGKGPEMEGSPPWEMMRSSPWMNQFAESAKAQERDYEKRRHLHKNFGSMCLF